MSFWSACASFFAIQIILQCQGISTVQTKLFQCTRMVSVCQSQCSEGDSTKYVKWTVELRTVIVSCETYSSSIRPPPYSNSSRPTTVFDIPCCSNGSSTRSSSIKPQLSLSQQQQQQQLQGINFVDEKKLDTLFILGVATLGSIMLMSAFIFMGLILYKQRTKFYAMKEKRRDETQPLVKQSGKNRSTIINVNNDNNAEYSNPENHTLPFRYAVSKQLSSEKNQSAIEGIPGMYQNRNSESSSGFGDDRQQNDLFKSSIKIRSETNEADDGETNRSSVKISKRNQVAGDYEARGGFISPVYSNSVAPNDSASVKAEYVDRQPTNNVHLSTDTADQSAVDLNKTFDSCEDDYVQAPPLKSHRSQSKPVEELTAYQKLIPSPSSQKEDLSDYNTLLHNSKVSSGDSKAFIILNDSQSSNSKSTLV